MFMPVLSGLVVSVDAFFIGLSLGMQRRCQLLYLAVINAFLLGLCVLGYVLAGQVYERIPIDPDWVVGFAFIVLGIWTMAQYFVTKCNKKHDVNTADATKSPGKAIILVGLVMSIEAMLITMGLTIIFAPEATLIIPFVVAFAHFAYSAFSFCLARSKYALRIPVVVSYIVSGLALVVYGLMALLVDVGI